MQKDTRHTSEESGLNRSISKEEIHKIARITFSSRVYWNPIRMPVLISLLLLSLSLSLFPPFSRVLGHDGYLHKPCIRIYDKAHELYVDVDWYRRFTPAQVTAIQQAVAEGKTPQTIEPTPTQAPAPLSSTSALKRRLHSTPAAAASADLAFPKRPGGLDIPADWTAESGQSLLCNEEGIDGGDPGGCRIEEWVLPLRTFSEFPSYYGIEALMPNMPEKNLAAMYGDDWMVPHQKGYKVVVCSWFPTGQFTFLLLILVTLIGPIGLYLAVDHVRTYGFTLSRSVQYQRLKQKDVAMEQRGMIGRF